MELKCVKHKKYFVSQVINFEISQTTPQCNKHVNTTDAASGCESQGSDRGFDAKTVVC